MAALEVLHEAIDRARQALAIQRHRGVHRGQGPAELFGETPAAGKAQHGGGQQGALIIRLDQAQVLLHQQPGHRQRICAGVGQVPDFIGQAVVQPVAVAAEPGGVMRRQIGGDHGQRLRTRGVGLRQGGKYIRMLGSQQAPPLREFLGVALIQFEPGGFGQRDQSDRHAVGAGLERQVDGLRRQRGAARGGVGRLAHGGAFAARSR